MFLLQSLQLIFCPYFSMDIFFLVQCFNCFFFIPPFFTLIFFKRFISRFHFRIFFTVIRHFTNTGMHTRVSKKLLSLDRRQDSCGRLSTMTPQFKNTFYFVLRSSETSYWSCIFFSPKGRSLGQFSKLQMLCYLHTYSRGRRAYSLKKIGHPNTAHRCRREGYIFITHYFFGYKSIAG